MTDNDWIPLSAMSKSAQYSFLYLHPKRLSYKKTWEDDLYEYVEKQYNQLSILDIIHGKFNTSKIKQKGKISQAINERLKIIEIAKRYKLSIKKGKSICPFHNDTDPSLVFYPKSNSFFCFGCRIGGDVINFIQRMETKNHG